MMKGEKRRSSHEKSRHHAKATHHKHRHHVKKAINHHKTHPHHKKATHTKHEHHTPKKILIVGIGETGCNSLVQMVLKGNKKYFPKLIFAKLPDFSGLGHREMEIKRRKFHHEFAKVMERSGNVVMSGSVTAKTPLGYTPLFTREISRSFKPDMTILLEIDMGESILVPDYGIVRKKVRREDVSIQQELNRYYASHLFGALTILPVQKGNVKKSLRELRELLLTAFKE